MKKIHDDISIGSARDLANAYDPKTELQCNELDQKLKPTQINSDECGRTLSRTSTLIRHKNYEHGKIIDNSDAIRLANMVSTATNSKRDHQLIDNPQSSASLVDDTLETPMHDFDAVPQAFEFPTHVSHFHQEYQCQERNMSIAYQNIQTSLYFSGHPGCPSVLGSGLLARPPEDTELELGWLGPNRIDLGVVDMGRMDPDLVGMEDVDLGNSQPYRTLLEPGLSEEFS